MKIEVTKAQLEAIKSMRNDIHAMIGCGNRDDIWEKHVMLVDRMLKKNRIKNERQGR